MSIDAEALARLRSLLAKATPGEWMPKAQRGRCDVLAGDIPVAETHWYPTHSRTDFVRGQDEALANAALIAAMHEALPALLDIAEAVARSPVARIETDGFADDGMPIVCLAADSIKAERAIKKMHMLRVRIVPCTGGAE